MESALLLGQVLTILSLSTTQSTWPPFILAAGTLAPTLIRHLSVLIQTDVYLTDVSWRSSLGHNIDPRLLFHQDLLGCSEQACQAMELPQGQLEQQQYFDYHTCQEFVATRFTGCGSGLPGLLQCHQNSSQKF